MNVYKEKMHKEINFAYWLKDTICKSGFAKNWCSAALSYKAAYINTIITRWWGLWRNYNLANSVVTLTAGNIFK